MNFKRDLKINLKVKCLKNILMIMKKYPILRPKQQETLAQP